MINTHVPSREPGVTLSPSSLLSVSRMSCGSCRVACVYSDGSSMMMARQTQSEEANMLPDILGGRSSVYPRIPLGLNELRKLRYCAASERVHYITNRPNTCCNCSAPRQVLPKLCVYITGCRLYNH